MGNEMNEIDFVIPWVDGDDPVWIQEKSKYMPKTMDNRSAKNRYRDWGFLKYLLRGIEKFAPWVHRVYLITCGQVPEWLNTEHPKLRMISHADYIPAECLPTFNSNTIELYIHLIPELSEKFVLFNDDTLLTAPVDENEFFKNGKPRESALMEAVVAKDPEDVLPSMLMNNMSLINKYFNKKEVLKKQIEKFYRLDYGTALVRNLLLTPFVYFTGFRGNHLPTSYLKSTFQKIWEKEADRLHETGKNRFRSRNDLTHWLMKSWQICEGNFIPRSIKWGHHYELGCDDTQAICNAIEQQKYKMICLNDSTLELDFNHIQKHLIESFEKILPEASDYEKE